MLEGRKELKGRRGRRRKQLLEDLKEKKRYRNSGKDALCRFLRTARFARDCGPFVKTDRALNEPGSDYSSIQPLHKFCVSFHTMQFIFFSEQTPIIALNSNMRLVFIVQADWKMFRASAAEQLMPSSLKMEPERLSRAVSNWIPTFQNREVLKMDCVFGEVRTQVLDIIWMQFGP
jgi:uncharacterized protein (DUF2461 family)